MVDRDVLAARLGELGKRIGKVRRRCPATPGNLGADDLALDVVSFNLMLAVQACLDIASHIIADEGWPPAATLKEAFDRLAEHAAISPATARALGEAAGLRNVVAHGYAGVDPARVHLAATRGLADLEAFASEVSRWVTGS